MEERIYPCYQCPYNNNAEYDKDSCPVKDVVDCLLCDDE